MGSFDESDMSVFIFLAAHTDANKSSQDSSSEAELPFFESFQLEGQIIQPRALLTQQAAKVALLQAKYRKQEKILGTLEESLREAKQISFKIQAKTLPINRVPPEVLGLIFTAHVQENRGSPWPLMQVSRTWRAVALMTRAIWGRIVLAPSNWAKLKGVDPHLRFWDGMEVCYKQAQLDRAPKRAEAIPLELKIVLSPMEHWYRRKSETTKCDLSVLRLPFHCTSRTHDSAR